MRVIRFRGKCKLLGRWMFGSLYIKKNGKIYINSTEVHPESVGQFTGLKDKNGVLIYEGDVVSSFADVFRTKVQWNEYQAGWSPFGDERTSFVAEESEVIADIYDCPFLLKEES